MATLTAAVPPKKRAATDAPGAPCPTAKKSAKDVATPAGCAVSGVPGWQYPPLPMGMIPPIPYCMPGNPFFPFMGMFPPFWFPAAAMAAATMPALAAASAANAGVASAASCLPGAASLQPTTAAMWSMMPYTTAVQPLLSGNPPAQEPARTASGVSSAVAIPSTSCTNSVPTVGAIQSPPSPPPTAASPVSVCNDSLQRPVEDDEFANFIDSFLLAGDGDVLLHCGDGDLSEPSVSDILQAGDLLSAGGSSSSDTTTDGGVCLTRSASHSLLSLLGHDVGLSDL